MRLYLAAHVQKKQATISWVGDVFDTRYNRAFRVSGEEPVSPVRKDVWAFADDALLGRIAAKSLDAIIAQASVTDSPTAPAPNPVPDDRSRPVASAQTPQTAAFADWHN